MKALKTMVMGLVIGGTTLTLAAQNCGGNGPGAGNGWRHGAQGFQPPVAAVLDIDSDGVLSAGEITGAPGQLLTLDANKDGQLAAAELCPAAGCGQKGKDCPYGGKGQGKGKGQGQGKCQNGQSVFLKLFDKDGDDLLSAVEINNAPAYLRELDKNQDGNLTPDELRPLPGCSGAGRGGCPWRPQS